MQKTVLLIDGNSLLYRGFFAMRMLTTSDGIPTNAIYSMALMLFAALDRMKPDGVVCAFDAPVATFRHEAYDDYKGQRASTPDELAIQRPYSRDLVRAFNIPTLEISGFEADDTIGTLAAKARREGLAATILTGDLDALQLVDDSGPITVVTTVKGVTETVIYDEAKVRERYGLSPSQIPDYKALKGDSSDNLPGIPSIGDKTATRLLTKYGTVEKMVADVDGIDEPKIAALMRTHGADALKFKDLATIRCSIPLGNFEFTLDYPENGINRELATQLFDRLEFRALLNRLGKPSVAMPTVTAVPQESALGISADVAPLTAIFFEFNVPLEKADFLVDSVKSISISSGDQMSTVSTEQIESVRVILEDENIAKVVHDAKLLIGASAELGITLRGVVFDTLLAAYLINPGRTTYRLPDLAADYCGLESTTDPGQLARYLRSLHPALTARLSEAGLLDLLQKIELPLSSILVKMEKVGVSVDKEWLSTVSKLLGDQIDDVERLIFALAGDEKFSIGSTKQLQDVLFEKLKLPTGKKTKTGYSTDSEVLDMLAAQGYDIAKQIASWRELSKLKSTYADNLQTLISAKDGRVHTSLNQTVTATGRLSSSNPNLQNIPVRTKVGREIRKSFTAGPGKVLLAADYSQIELRIFAHITQDPELVRTFQADEDIHRRTASLLFDIDENLVTSEQRRRAKTINFAVIYGMSDFRLANELGIDVATANRWKKQYFAEYPGVNAFASAVLDNARRDGYVQTLLGRRRYTPDINSRVFQFRQSAEREAVNMPVQGTAADIIKLAMIDVDRELRESSVDAVMTLQVHDELVFECSPESLHEASGIVAACMENAYALSVRLKVEVKSGHNWAEMVPIENVLDNERKH